MAFTERETWLVAAAVLIQTDIFAGAGIPALAPKHRISCGFPIGYRGSKSGKITLGQAFDPSISADGTYEIFINPILSEPLAVFSTLVHELLHVHAGIQAGHRGAFAIAARAVGLEGPLTATVAGEALRIKLENVAALLGNYPHASVDPNARKKQGTRLLKLECSDCKWVVRISAKQAARLTGHAPCPCCLSSGTLVLEGSEGAE